MAIARGKTIEQLRTERKWSQTELAWQVDVEPETIRRAERGVPDIGLLLRLADAFGVEPEHVVLPPTARLIKAGGHYYMIEHEGPNEARVTGVTAEDTTARVGPGEDDESAFYPTKVLFNSHNRAWIESDPDPDVAISRLADRIRAAVGRP
jgi:transcriptional regulator with XRE-family HTH domain